MIKHPEILCEKLLNCVWIDELRRKPDNTALAGKLRWCYPHPHPRDLRGWQLRKGELAKRGVKLGGVERTVAAQIPRPEAGVEKLVQFLKA